MNKTKEQFIEELKACASLENEGAHSRADDLLLEFLKSIGHEDVADAWRYAEDHCGSSGGFWYS